ncbi:hypothetical protein IWX62_002897, partial [Arthrobacter sp. CAN_A1]
MKSRTASSTGTGFFPGSGADSGSASGSADTGADTSAGASSGSSDGTRGGTSGRTSGGYGAGGPLGVDAVWASPPVQAPEPGPEAASPGSGAGSRDGGRSDADAQTHLVGEPSVLSGRVAVTAMAALDPGQTLGVLKDLGRLRSWVDAQEAKAVTHLHDLTADAHPFVSDGGRVRALAAAELAAATLVPEVTAGILIDHSDLLTRDFPTTLAALEEG